MIREVDLVSYLPSFLQEYKEQNNALTAENPEFTIVWNATDRVLYNEFISTADEYGIARYEKILGILPFAEDTLESRRARVQSRWFTSIPYTMKSLTAQLISSCGSGNFTVTTRFEKYQITINVSFELFGQMEELERVLQTMMPCNIAYTLRNTIYAYSTSIPIVAAALHSVESIHISDRKVDEI